MSALFVTIWPGIDGAVALRGADVIDVWLLGPPRVDRDGAMVAFDTRKAMALLALLALSDTPRPRDVLADLLWPAAGLDHARGALRRTLSSLRSGIGADRVEATRDHVRLVRGAGLRIDVDRFRGLRTAGALEEAAAEHRGSLMEGFAVRDAPGFEAWLEVETDALRRELTATLSELASAQESAGHLAGAVDTVRRWLAQDPLHEPAHQALVRLYAASGDRAAAVAQYRACVLTLSRELGVAPLTATTELYEAVTRGEVAPAPVLAPPSPPVAASPPEPAFVGRGADLAALAGGYTAVGAEGRVALVEGDAGIGKSRLVQELLTAVGQHGAVVLTGRGYEDESGLAYAPVVDMLRERLREDHSWLGAVDEATLTETARLLPELVAMRDVPAPDGFDQPGAEGRFLAATWDTIAAATAGPATGVVVLDDAQWADEATLRLLAYGIRRLTGRPLLILLVWRTPHEHPVRRAALDARSAAATAHVVLEGLGEEAVSEMVRSVSATPVDPTLVRRLWEATDGVPLLLVELLRTLDDETPLLTGARDLLSARLSSLSEQGRQVLAAAAVLGRQFGADEVRATSGRTEAETATALEELVGRGVLRLHEQYYDFRHEMVRSIVYEDTSLSRRRLLHSRAADAIGAPPAAVARHLQFGGRDAAAAVAFLEAGERAREVFANDEALVHVRTAMGLGHPHRTRLLTMIADLETVLGDYAAALLSLETAAAGCAPDELSGVEHRLGRLQHRRGEYALAEVHLGAALEAVPETELGRRALIAADLSLAVHAVGATDRARSLAREAVDQAVRADEPHALSQAYNVLGMVATSDGDSEEALVHLDHSRALAEELRDSDLLIAALNNLALVRRARGELDDALQLTGHALELCSKLGDRHREAALHNNLADLLHASGRAGDAMVHLKAAVRIFADVGVEDHPRPEIWKLVRW